MNDRVRKAGVYLASANWEKLALLAIGAGAAWHYVAPLLASVVLPAVLHHVYQARVIGRQALYQAYLRAFQGASQERAERMSAEGAQAAARWAREEKSEGVDE